MGPSLGTLIPSASSGQSMIMLFSAGCPENHA
jgi:hypothetical protein